MDHHSYILATVFMLMMLALLIVGYIRQHKILKEMKKAGKARENRFRKV